MLATQRNALVGAASGPLPPSPPGVEVVYNMRKHLPFVADQKMAVEKVWREFFSDPSKWWDHRLEKENARYPDFKHKSTQESLWLNGKFVPPWVEGELVALAPGTLQRNSFSWNTKLSRYNKAGQYEKTLEYFAQMHTEDIIPDRFTFVPVLNACANLQALEEGNRIHTLILRAGCESDVYISNSLVDMYSKCGRTEDAWRVFQKMPARSVVSWNAMIQGYVKNGQGQKALKLYRRMQEEALEPVRVTYLALLNACASLMALKKGRKVHEQIVQSSYQSDIYVANSLVDMYAKCGSIEDAWSVFINMPRRDVVTWNAMIRGYVKVGKGQKAIELYRQMELQGVEPDTVTFVGCLNACARVAALEEGRRVHEQIIQRGCESDIFVSNSLVDMYAKCGSLEDAWRLFNKMPTRNVVAWNAMILGHVRSGEGQKALQLFRQMEQEGVDADPVTFVGLLNACACSGGLEKGRQIHAEVTQRGWESNVFVGTSLVDMYAKCGSIEDALGAFQKLPTHSVVSWNAMILGYVKCGHGVKALELSRKMQQAGVRPDSVTFVGMVTACTSIDGLEEGRRVHEHIIQAGYDSDVFVSSSLIDMYAKCGSIEEAWRVFNKMPVHNVVVWSAIIQAFVKCGQGQKALELIRKMQDEGVQPDPVTFVGFVSACASVGAIEEGRRIHAKIIQSGCEWDVVVGNSLIDMYAKCGSIEDAWRVFKTMPTRDVVSWTAMLGGYAMHGHGKEALAHFKRMWQEGVELDSVTFISLLSACKHAGLVDEGLLYFKSMCSIYAVSPSVEHYSCMVDLLSCAGRLSEADGLIKMMSCEVDATACMSLLAACRAHGNPQIGDRVAKHIIQSQSRISKIYCAPYKVNSSGTVQRRLEKVVKAQSARTWIEVNNQVHSFTIEDQEHPQVSEIRAELKRLSKELKEVGYVPDVRSVSVNVEEEESHLRHHSAKLAIAFGLINTPAGTLLRIFKNIRVCGDCHTAIKSLSKVVGRPIIVRDTSRFHHFESGVCSCRDFW